MCVYVQKYLAATFCNPACLKNRKSFIPQWARSIFHDVENEEHKLLVLLKIK